MAEVLYNILILGLAVVGIIKGFRYGLTGQVSNVIGFAFGAVCAHAFIEDGEEILRSIFPSISAWVGSQFVYSILAAAIIYVAVYFAFSLLTKVLRSTMSVFQIGLLDSLMGALFGCFKYLLGLSLFFNLIVAVDSSSCLLKSSVASDGNLIEGVMGIAPWSLGAFNYEEYAHLIQLHEARKISQALPNSEDKKPMSLTAC